MKSLNHGVVGSALLPTLFFSQSEQLLIHFSRRLKEFLVAGSIVGRLSAREACLRLAVPAPTESLGPVFGGDISIAIMLIAVDPGKSGGVLVVQDDVLVDFCIRKGKSSLLGSTLNKPDSRGRHYRLIRVWVSMYAM